MPIMIFWITPILVALIVLLFITQHKSSNKPKLFLVEPLLFLVKQWHLARIEGNEKLVRQYLSLWLPGLEMDKSLSEQLVRQIVSAPPLINPKQAVVLGQKRLPFWAEQRQVEINGKKTSLLLGSVEEVVSYCDADSSGPLTPGDRIAWPVKADKAHKNGYMTLAVAQSSTHDPLLRRKYKLIGVAILEPVINEGSLLKIRQMASLGQVRFMSLASPLLVADLMDKVFPGRKQTIVNVQELEEYEPVRQEKAIEGADIFGLAGSKNRHYIARYLQRSHHIILVSHLAMDDQLPSDTRL